MESTGEGGAAGGGGGPGPGFSEIETATEGLARSEVFHVVKEIIGFALYMHHQIPSILQSLEDEFIALKEEFKSLVESDLPPAKVKASDQRKHNSRKKEVRRGIRRQEKLMNGISILLSALQHVLDEVPCIEGVTLVLGGSIARPLHVYDIVFSHGRFNHESATECDTSTSKVAQSLSRKAIRALVSAGAGGSYTGPCKLFLLIKCPWTLNLPLHFLPKRDFRYSKKAIPFRLLIKCRVTERVTEDRHRGLDVSASNCIDESSINDVIWFQCRHTVKGLACKIPTEC